MSKNPFFLYREGSILKKLNCHLNSVRKRLKSAFVHKELLVIEIITH